MLAHLLGDPNEANLQAPVTSYEDMHNAAQSILLPPTYPRGLSFHLLQPLARGLALQHKVSLMPGEYKLGPEAAFGGPSQEKGTRSYSLGGVATHELAGGGKWRASGALDPESLKARATLLGDVWGEGRLRVLVQAAVDPAGPAPQEPAPGRSWWARSVEWGATATLRGADYVAVGRVKQGVEVGGSYCQRLAPGSPLTVGGELMLNVAELRAAAAPAAGSGARRGRPLELALGCAYDAPDSKTSLHYAATSTFASSVLSLQHLLKVTERSHLAAKVITDSAVTKSMVAVGCRTRFRNTLTTLHGMVDSYGSVRQVRWGVVRPRSAARKRWPLTVPPPPAPPSPTPSIPAGP